MIKSPFIAWSAMQLIRPKPHNKDRVQIDEPDTDRVRNTTVLSRVVHYLQRTGS